MNKNIENFLNEYMINPDPQYAVFLKGNWGCGKTFFVNNWLNSYKMTLTDFTLHFSCCFTKILHSQLNPLLNNFTMQEKCY